jgi:signal transduction histidine kinase
MEQLRKTNQKIQVENLINSSIFSLDKTIVRNILVNLISNAIKFSPENSEIVVKLFGENKELIISIKDNGIGIPFEDQAHLFSRFFRARNAENIKGTGLGLHIVQRYAEMLGGTINFESEIGTGTTFTVQIPTK